MLRMGAQVTAKPEQDADAPSMTRQLARLACLVESDLSALHSQKSPKRIHDTRIDLSRYRVAIRSLKPGMPPQRRRRCMSALRFLMKELNAVRDADVRERLVRRLSTHLDLQDHEQTAMLLAAAAEERKAARRALSARMDLPKWSRRLWDLRQAGTLIDSDGRQDLDAVRGVVRRRRRRLTKLLRERAHEPRRLHRLRLRIKDVRYFTEDFGALLGEPPSFELMHLRALQKQLGELRDERALRAWLRRQYRSYLVAGAMRTLLKARRRERMKQVGRLRKALR